MESAIESATSKRSAAPSNPKSSLGCPPLSTLGSAAVLYAERFGFAVFPCIPRGKAPLTAHGCLDATKDLEQIAAWWTRLPDGNVGVACGSVSGRLLVLDIDGDEGRASLQVLEKRFGQLPPTPLSLTGEGLQYFLKTTAKVKNRVGVLPGIDVRTDGGYVIAEPSIHPNGRQYAWEVSAHLDDVPIAQAPEWLITMLTGADARGPNRPNWRTRVCQDVREGARNATLASIVGGLLRSRINPRIALEFALYWNGRHCQPPLFENEVLAVVNSIAGAEYRRLNGGRRG